MEYSVGSLADLISGNQTENKVKVVSKSFTPVKKENAAFQSESDDTAVKKPKKMKDKPKLKAKRNKPFQKNKIKKLNDESIENSLKKEMKRSIEKPLYGKRKLNGSVNTTKEDQDESETTSPKMSKNELNAANRIKNKINKEQKSSTEYKERTLFVGNLPITITVKKIKTHFKQYGMIDSVRIRGIPVADINTPKKVAAIKKEFHPDRSSVYAFIRFKEADDAKKAEVENGQIFMNHHLRVNYCESEEKPDESKAIFVGNLPFNAEEEELWNLFKTCGPISHVRIVRDGRTNMGKGFGYINFQDSDSVELALEMGKVTLKDRELRVSLCDTNRAKKKKVIKKEGQQKGVKGNKKEKGTFSGTKFNDIKKKKKFNKTLLDKKKLAKKLIAPKAEQD